ncbi:MAG TPA: cytochrome c maturation protein CcmE [Acidimicrobiia bacterium]|nr:cytochrome c maturation protein CcmE [Acidimicrobiia bacterium]
MPSRKVIWPVLALLAAAVLVLIATNLGDSLTYYLTPQEAVARRAEFPDGHRFRLGGLVEAGSLRQEGNVRIFDVTDGAETITVHLRTTPPPLFAEDVGVVVEGAWSGDRFDADVALIRHDETYQPPTTTPAT